ncbi:putative hydroxypyruvate isomerase [Hydractinia symbiolongicarpus]|uniref:putative hydroxypyruvate isomerase n=1 Tax=Hydractinia symbiolongicarpus TaxID=13093 RepID=UPI00254A3F86|nr:putative hydroxypyruvate isomerase [Hydractinia symbiolongicarpus]
MAAMQHAARHISRLNFAANLSFLFPEIPDFKQRYAAAKEAGFGGVECGAEIYAIPISELVSVKENSNIIQVLLNSQVAPSHLVVINYINMFLNYYGLNLNLIYRNLFSWLIKFLLSGDNYGIAAVPSRADEFRQCLELSIQYCNALKCKRMHIMAGQYPEGLNITKEISRSYKETYLNNLKFASQRLELENIKLLIEPISTIPNYFLTRTDQALQILKALNCKNVFLQLDVYHHQRTHGNIADTISENIDFIGHIQIGQVPGRHEPDQSGEINFQFVFNHLLKVGYTGWIGCEYLPSGPKTDLSWLKPYLYV